MLGFDEQPVANGVRTDHPIPELPFVDDGHVPVEDAVAVEAVGRKAGPGMWGREDPCDDGGWIAFTTDPKRRDLAWMVRWHPEHGRSVVLYRDEHAATMHMRYQEGPLLFRAGGYWWDGITWYRPSQVWDRAQERYVRRSVPAAHTVSAADRLQGGEHPERARILPISEVEVGQPLKGDWLDHLALWAAQRTADQLRLSDAVVNVTAPELSADQLVGVSELAELAGVAASTLRAYVARGEGDIPQPQAVISGRNAWSRAVGMEWVEQRRSSPESVAEALGAGNPGESGAAPGILDMAERIAAVVLARLWSPGLRKRWALRWRNEGAVRDISEDIGWYVAATMDRLVPASDIAVTVKYALLHDITWQHGSDAERGQETTFFGVVPHIARLLGWLIRTYPDQATFVLGELIGQVEDDLGIPRSVTISSLRTALSLDGKLSADARKEFFARAFVD